MWQIVHFDFLLFISQDHSSQISKFEQKLSFISKPQPPNLQQTVANTILITNIINSNNLSKFWVGIFTRQGHINQVY